MINNFRKLIDCLNRQIGELEKLCRLKDDRIRELETKLSERDAQPVSTWPYRGWAIQIETCQHEYPNPWGATVPPVCKKCGQPARDMQVTCVNGKSETQWR